MEIIITIGIIAGIGYFMKFSRTYKILLGFFLMLVAIPAGIFAEIGVNGCCASSDTGFRGLGYILMAGLFLAGLILTIKSIRSKQN